MKNYHYKIGRVIAAIAVCSMVVACAQPNTQTRGFARANLIVWDKTDAKLSALGYSDITVETEHRSFEVAGGISVWDTDGKKKSTLEVLLGISEFYDVDATELSGGGRFYFAQNETVRPYGSMHGVLTMLDDDLGTQIGMRAGAGAEFAFGTGFFFDLNLNYLLPLVPAEDDIFGAVETEIDGLSFRIGAGFDF
jgi:opacity protein-like surface antigen